MKFILILLCIFSGLRTGICRVVNAGSPTQGLEEDHPPVLADTNQVDKWNDLGNGYKFSRPDSGIYYTTKALAMARSLSFVQGEVRALHNMALSYRTLGNEAKSFTINLECLRIAEQEGFNDYMAYSLISLGVNYSVTNRFDFAKSSFLKARSLFSQIGDTNFVATTESFLGRVYLDLNDVDSAFYCVYRAIRLAESMDIEWVKHQPYSHLAELFKYLGNADSAQFYFRKAYHSAAGKSGMCHARLEMARFFRDSGQLDSSVVCEKEALTIAKENSLYPQLIQANLLFSDLYEQVNPVKALWYQKMAMAYTDSLANLSKIVIVSDITDFDEQQRQYELQAAQDKFQSQLRTNIFLGSTFTLLVVGFFLYGNNRQMQKAKQQIENAYGQLKSTQSQLIQSEKMASLGELTAGIAHEIQNPLNFVNNFSEVNSELTSELVDAIAKGDIDAAKSIANSIKENDDKISSHGKRADSIVKSMLQHSRTTSGQKQLTDVNALCEEYLRLAYHGFRAKDKSFIAKFKTDLDPSIPEIDVVPQDIGRVILNLINNAFHAVSEKAKVNDEEYEPLVSVSTNRKENGIQIKVKDNGSGIPDSIKEKIFQPFFTTKPAGQGTGLGLSLSYDIVKAHGGELNVVTKEGPSLLFTSLVDGF